MMKMTLLNARETACPDKKYWYTPSLFPYSGTIYSINSSDATLGRPEWIHWVQGRWVGRQSSSPGRY